MQAAWPDWYGPGGTGNALADLQARATPGLPQGWVAVIAGQPVGTVAVAQTSYGAQGDGPWLVGLVVDPAHRGQGIGAALIGCAERVGPLLTTTREAAPLFAARGWTILRDVEDGWQVWRSP